MVYSKKFIHNECAVSEVLGEVLLTLVIIIVMTSIGTFVLSESKPSEVPHVDFYEQLDPFNDTIVLFNNGGKPVPIKEFKLVLQSDSTEYVINGEELSSKLTEQCGDNGYWDLGEYISINVSEMCSFDLENRYEDLNIFFIHTPSKQVIQKSFIPSIYLDDKIPGEEYDEGGIWVPPQLLALDNSKSTKSVNGSACLDDVQKMDDGKSTTYYPNNDASTCEYFEFGLNKSVLESFGATFLDYEHLNISGAKIKVVYAKHDNSFRWGKLKVRDQTSGTSCEHYLFDKNMRMYNYNGITYIEDEFDLPYITTTEDLENLNVSIFAKIPGNGYMHYIHIDYIAVYIPCIVKKSPAPVVPQGDLIHIGSVNVTKSANNRK